MKKKGKEQRMSVQAELLAIKDTYNSLRILIPLLALLQVILIVTWIFDMTGDRSAMGGIIYLSGYVFMLLASICVGVILHKCSKSIGENREKFYHTQMTYAWMLPVWTAVLTMLDAVNASPTFNVQFYVMANVLTMGICYMEGRKWELIQIVTGLTVFASALLMPGIDHFTFVSELLAYLIISVIAGRFIFSMKIKSYERQAELAGFIKRVEYDSLTGVYTREAFYHKVEELLNKDQATAYTLIASDVDNFKQFNSIFGNEKGNEILCYLADEFKKYGKITSRYGADQFISIFPESEKMTGEELDKVISNIAERAPVKNLVVKYGYYDIVNVNIPVSTMCDRALLAAKSIRYDYTRKVARYDGPVSQKQLKAKKYANDFKEALEGKEFVVWYQPKIDPYTGRVASAEALVRWVRPSGQILSPGEFLEGFEENGQIIELDEYIFRSVCLQQKKWMEEGRKLFPISVNISRISMNRTDLVPVYKKMIEGSGLPISMVPVEITESAAIRSVMLKPVVQELYDSGFVIHMDDFGSGQSSINGLNLFHVDVVKLDKSLVDTIGTKNGDTILSGLIDMVRKLGYRIVAEGVETEEQVKFLIASNIDEIQGYYYSRPLPEKDFVEFIRKSVN